MESAKHWVGPLALFGCAVMKPCCKELVSHHHLPNPGATIACVLHQVPGAEDQTALSLEECLRLLEATFPFGENSEVSREGEGFCLWADPEAAALLSSLAGVSVPLVPLTQTAEPAVNWVSLLKEAPGIVPVKLGGGWGGHN